MKLLLEMDALVWAVVLQYRIMYTSPESFLFQPTTVGSIEALIQPKPLKTLHMGMSVFVFFIFNMVGS